jgi:hypothetical protein
LTCLQNRTAPRFNYYEELHKIITHNNNILFIGFLQSFLGVYSIRIENVDVRWPPSDDLRISGVTHPHDFRKVIKNNFNLLDLSSSETYFFICAYSGCSSPYFEHEEPEFQREGFSI